MEYIKLRCLCDRENEILMVGDDNADGKAKCECGRNITVHLRRHVQKVVLLVASQQAVENRLAEIVQKSQVKAGEQAVCENLKRLGL